MNKNRVTSIDGIKSIAFLLVFISHIPRLNLSANPFGAAGVEIYFICSGFLAHYSQSNRGDCPKTKDSILKVEDNPQYAATKMNNMVSENDLTVHSGIKVENEDGSKPVFGQPVGGRSSNFELLRIIAMVGIILFHITYFFQQQLYADNCFF